jgi:hypothetical protein
VNCDARVNKRRFFVSGGGSEMIKTRGGRGKIGLRGDAVRTFSFLACSMLGLALACFSSSISLHSRHAISSDRGSSRSWKIVWR